MCSLLIRNINKSFDGIQAVNNFSFKWCEPNIIGLIGPNGAGKTTLFNIITGFIECDSGQILLGGFDIKGLPPHKVVYKGIARTFQDNRLLGQITVIENILFNRLKQTGQYPFSALLKNKKYWHDKKNSLNNAESILDIIGLANKRDVLASELSYGEQKLLTLGCCIATDAHYLLLDEPVSGINPRMIEIILELLRNLSRQGKKILLIEHNIDAIRSICDWLVVMDAGKNIAEGFPSDVLQKEEIIDAYLD